MAKRFNTTGACLPARHYMVDLTSRLNAIKVMIDNGDYFTINCGRQYGKTTTLLSLVTWLKSDYEVVFLDFQRMGSVAYENEATFVDGFLRVLLMSVRKFPEGIREQFLSLRKETAENRTLAALFEAFVYWCAESERPVVLMIDEVDTATNNQVFLDFLAQIRAAYLTRDIIPTFQSVILAGVHDVRNIKRKIRPDDESKVNSPWNIAADYLVNMSFQMDDIASMLTQYEEDYHTGMDIEKISSLIYDYTSGYPFLISRICKLMDENLADTDEFHDRNAVWTEEGVMEAVKLVLNEKNALFQSLFEKLNRYPEMKNRIYELLFRGQTIPYNADDPVTDLLQMFGFVRVENATVQIANRIFETRLYNYFLLSPEAEKDELFRLADREKSQFISHGRLNMDYLLEKFVEYFDDIYGDKGEKFVEDDGRRYFMLFLKPIINGTGNYYVEARTRNHEQTDLIIDYLGTQHVVELKIWRGNSYNERGEQQLSGYLDHYHLKKGYMLSFCFNKNKNIGVHQITLGDKVLVEAIV